MKLNKIIIAAAVLLGAVACGNQKGSNEFKGVLSSGQVSSIEKQLADLLPSKESVDSVSYLFGVNIGATIKNYNFGDLNMSKLISGVKDMAAAKGDPRKDENFDKQFKIGTKMIGSTINGYLQAKNDSTYVPAKATIDSVSYLLGLDFGNTVKQNDFGTLNYNELLAGIDEFLAAEGDDIMSEEFLAQFKINPMQMGDIINGFLESRQEYKVELNRAKGEKFLEKNKSRKGVQETESGLQYKIIEKGNDVVPGPEDVVKVHYTGWLLDGTEFDATKEEPIEFPLNRVIAGWTEGLQLIGEGGKIMLYIPYDLAYGEMSNPYSPIPGCSTLVFEVELVAVPSKAEAELAPVEEEVVAEDVEPVEE